MAKTDYQNVDEYLAAQSEVAQRALREVRKAINEAVPDGEEVISYQIPAVRSDGWVFYFSAATRHFSLSQPPPFEAFNEFAEELAPRKRTTSAVQFPYDQPVPAELIGRMAAFQAAENAKKASKRAAN